jgi:hypothetical protein
MSNTGSTGKGNQHKIHEGLTGKQASQYDSSRSCNGRSVNDGATRDSVAVGTSTGKDGGKLK